MSNMKVSLDAMNWMELDTSPDDIKDGTRRLVRIDQGTSAFAIRGERGAIEYHFHHSDPTLGGIEYHSSRAPGYDLDKKASHERCKLLNGQCWHDGTSLWASEHWAPRFKISGSDWVWSELRCTYSKWSKEEY